ncbi:unnamed protein product [Caenorhabditis nigoni]
MKVIRYDLREKERSQKLFSLCSLAHFHIYCCSFRAESKLRPLSSPSLRPKRLFPNRGEDRLTAPVEKRRRK